MTIRELDKEIAEKELMAQKMTDDLFHLQTQLTKYITSGNKGNEEWYGRASVAYQAMKRKIRKLNQNINKLKMERKAMMKEHQKDRDRLQNELFYRKLKELLPEEQLVVFLRECEDEIHVQLERRTNDD